MRLRCLGGKLDSRASGEKCFLLVIPVYLQHATKTGSKAGTRQQARCKAPSSSTSSAALPEARSQDTSETVPRCEWGQEFPDPETPWLPRSVLANPNWLR